jgi:deoxycytidylate deaminase
MRKRIERFLEIVFDVGIHTPTTEETAMYKACASAANSACMSRQVGASIVSNTGELIAVGCNDVPRFAGGLYNEDDRMRHTSAGPEDRDRRCYNWRGGICHNETRRNSIIDDIVQRIANADGMLQPGRTAVDVKNAMAGSGVDALIEFSRSIHAEMEAILSVAREGKHSLVGATLFTTTYPCHNCARHIVAAGISDVVYIEPYQKSLAVALHEDAITESREEQGKVVFRQFDGVAPDNFLKLFRTPSNRKKNGKIYRTPPIEAVPIFRIPLDAQSQYEDKVIADLSEKEQI